MNSRQREPADPSWSACFHPEFLDDLHYWVKTDRKIAPRALDLVEAILKDPFSGIGKPEQLKYLLAGAWSRRLAQEHRIVYLVKRDQIHFLQAQYQYRTIHFPDSSSASSGKR